MRRQRRAGRAHDHVYGQVMEPTVTGTQSGSNGSQLTADDLFARFRMRFAELMPVTMDVRAEPDTPLVLEKTSTITMKLPVRGNVQVRVEELTAREAVLITVAGHPLAGAVRFLAEQVGDLLRFQVQLYDRPANLADWVLMRALGESVQASSWEIMLQKLLAESGGSADKPVQHDEETLDGDKTERVEAWLRDLILARKREQNSAATATTTKKSAKHERAESTLGEDAMI